MQGCVISCGAVMFFQKSRNLLRSLLTNNNFYCEGMKKGRMEKGDKKQSFMGHSIWYGREKASEQKKPDRPT